VILRRIITHVRKQEWAAIAIDFLIVVLGVFLGIQLGNWNEPRLERAQSAVFTRALEADRGFRSSNGRFADSPAGP